VLAAAAFGGQERGGRSPGDEDVVVRVEVEQGPARSSWRQLSKEEEARALVHRRQRRLGLERGETRLLASGKRTRLRGVQVGGHAREKKLMRGFLQKESAAGRWSARLPGGAQWLASVWPGVGLGCGMGCRLGLPGLGRLGSLFPFFYSLKQFSVFIFWLF
jgi:hypothetical protein